jgi:hypothetical protein
LEMKKELKIALQKEQEDLEMLNSHLQLIEEIINVLQNEFDLSAVKDKYINYESNFRAKSMLIKFSLSALKL